MDIMKIESHGQDHSSINTPRKVSFFDVGGLLEEDQPRRVSSIRTMDTDGGSSFGPLHSSYGGEQGLSPAPPRRGGSALLQDVGGLLGPRRERPQRGIELATILREENEPSTSHNLLRQQTTHSLQDVGGLLR
jgi:hypothetical protein